MSQIAEAILPAKVNEIETVNYKDTALLSYYNGENLYIYDEDDPCYMRR